MKAAILNSTILDSSILHKIKLHSFIFTQLDDGNQIEFYRPGFSYFVQNKTSLIYSDSSW